MKNDTEDEEYEEIEPSLRNILDQESLKWIFVGGKGGVGKTTTACSLAIQLAAVRRNVLIISTDPAHNISDAFSQQIGKRETAINGFDNLFALEIDPEMHTQAMADSMGDGANAGLLSELMNSVPGIDEAMSFAELMRQVQKMNYEVIVFDTAPTGHTIRLLGFPQLLETGIKKLIGLKDRFAGIFSQISSAVSSMTDSSKEEVLTRLEATKQIIEFVHRQFQDSNLTTFVCVMIPEFLSVFETERLIQQLSKFGIDTHCLVVNQVLFPDKDSNCRKCFARVRMQQKYLTQIGDLYEDFNIVTVPLLDNEVRGVSALTEFSTHLMVPFDPTTESSSNDADQEMNGSE
uniref:ATPase ASNA1 homolog n=1 Tax=Hirondellea gigas TaxID=1518452 RepID=A0A6A7G2N4_9CRUS